jgi:hypothetical protein
MNNAAENYPVVSTRKIGYDIFNPTYKSPTVAIHKAAIEMAVLGCPLPAQFLIHHIDRDKKNFRPANLVILTERQHRICHSAWGNLQNFNGVELYWSPKELLALHDSNVKLIQSRAVFMRPLIPVLEILSYCKEQLQ